MNETTSLLPTAAAATSSTGTLAGGDSDATDNADCRFCSNALQTTSKYYPYYGAAAAAAAAAAIPVVVRPWSESENGSDATETECCETTRRRAKRKSVLPVGWKTCLFLCLCYIFLWFSFHSNSASDKQTTTSSRDYTTTKELSKSRGNTKQKMKNNVNEIHKNDKNNDHIMQENGHEILLVSMDDFLQERQAHPTRHFVIGNKAADADSVVSALTLAYIESSPFYAAMRLPNNAIANNADTVDAADWNQKTPIASLTRADFQTQRPDISLLLQWAGIDSNHVTFVDDPVVVEASATMNTSSSTTTTTDSSSSSIVDVTLTDHNVMDIDMPLSWSVVEIVDHHVDQGQHTETCFGDSRLIAFEQKKALVASTCTLVAERMQQVWAVAARSIGSSTSGSGNNKNKGKIRSKTAIATVAPLYYPASVSLLLLGVILIDSMNLEPQAKAVTPRDISAVQDLLEHTNWRDLPLETQNQLGILGPTISGGSSNSNSNSNNSNNNHNNKPDTTLIFNKLQDAKYNPDFWKSLSVRDALRLDYKDFTFGDGVEDDEDSADGGGSGRSDGDQADGLFGISSIRIPIEDFLANKQDLVTDITNFMVNDAHVDFLAIMPVFLDKNGQYVKQLVLINRNNGGDGDGDSATPPSYYYLEKLKLYLLQQESLGLQQIQVNIGNQNTVGLRQTLLSPSSEGGNSSSNNVDESSSPKGIMLLENDDNPNESISLVFFNQLKMQPSRKQIGPILRTFFENSTVINRE